MIFDFEKTKATAIAIDEIARAARAELDQHSGNTIVAHCDWALQNVSFRGGRLVGVFDWDSLAVVSEVLALAGAAVFHQQDWRYRPNGSTHDFYPDPDWALKFVDLYAQERQCAGTSGLLEPEAVHAALVYRLAYQARCEHALAPGTVGPAHQRLEVFARAFRMAA